ncbi:MAG: PTS lactose/cellobiose transporter subunit IIA [Lactobacillales bacterium]|jgi:PTS system cellobiose-specific IIA component|nr:PTS lactose/cellobiose transporter subunit IIA [Lactobacillales bacterium]
MAVDMNVVMGLIMYGGDAKASAYEAIFAAKAGDFELADSKIVAAKAALSEAHHQQTDLLTKAAQGEQVDIDIYMIHAQDHVMTSIAFVDIAQEIIDLHKKIDNK